MFKRIANKLQGLPRAKLNGAALMTMTAFCISLMIASRQAPKSAEDNFASWAFLAGPVGGYLLKKWPHVWRFVAISGIAGSTGWALDATAASEPNNIPKLIGACTFIAANLYQFFAPENLFSDKSRNKIIKILNKPLAASAYAKLLTSAPPLILGAIAQQDGYRAVASFLLLLGLGMQAMANQPDLKLPRIQQKL